MCPAESISAYSRLHFLQFERSIKAQKEDPIKYVVKNHFNTPVIKVEGKQSNLSGNLELNVINLQTTKQKTLSNELFRITASTHPIYNSDDIPSYKACTLLSTSGETLGRVVNVKDIGLLTCSYNLTNNASQLLFQVYKKRLCDGQYELHIKPTSKDNVIARIEMEENTISLSMAPELNSDTKMRLICLMIFKVLEENAKGKM